MKTIKYKKRFFLLFMRLYVGGVFVWMQWKGKNKKQKQKQHGNGIVSKATVEKYLYASQQTVKEDGLKHGGASAA